MKKEIETSNKYKPLILTDKDIINLSIEIDDIISEICKSNGYDIKNLKLNNWLYILGELNRLIFKVRPELIRQYNPTYKAYREYIDENVEKIYYLYSALCDRYGCIKRKRHFFTFIGVHRYTLYSSTRKDSKFINNGLRRLIEEDCEESLVNATVSDRGNPLKYLAVLNHDHYWNRENSKPQDTEKQLVSLEKLPKIELLDNSRTPDDTDDTESDDIV